jgi:hypothetical protein
MSGKLDYEMSNMRASTTWRHARDGIGSGSGLGKRGSGSGDGRCAPGQLEESSDPLGLVETLLASAAGGMVVQGL